MIHWIHKILFWVIIWISFYPREVLGQTEEIFISDSFYNTSFSDFIRKIEDQHQIHFYYDPDWLDTMKVTGSFNHESLKNVISIIFKNTNIRYHYYNGNVFLITNTEGDQTLYSYYTGGQIQKVVDMGEGSQVIEFEYTKIATNEFKTTVTDKGLIHYKYQSYYLTMF